MQNPALDMLLNFDYRFFVAIGCIFVVQAVLLTVAYWKLFTKAGAPGWAALIPFYNVLIMLKIARKPWWWLLLVLIPLVGLVWGIWALNLFIKSFGKGEEYTVASVFFPHIFLPFLAFDKEAVFMYAPIAKPLKS